MKTMQAEEAIKEKELAERNRHLRGRHREEIRNVQKLRQWQKQEILKLLQSMKLFSKRTDRVRKINRQLRNNVQRYSTKVALMKRISESLCNTLC